MHALFQQESGSAMKELEKKFDEVSKVMQNVNCSVAHVPVPVATCITTLQISRTAVLKYSTS